MKQLKKTGEFIRKEIVDKIAKPKANSVNVEEIIILPKKEKKIERIKKSIIEVEHHEISKLLAN